MAFRVSPPKLNRVIDQAGAEDQKPSQPGFQNALKKALSRTVQDPHAKAPTHHIYGSPLMRFTKSAKIREAFTEGARYMQGLPERVQVKIKEVAALLGGAPSRENPQGSVGYHRRVAVLAEKFATDPYLQAKIRS